MTIEVRYNEAKRATLEPVMRKLVRTQGASMLILAVLLGLMVVVPIIVAVTDGFSELIVLAALLVIPIAIGALGVRQLRRQVHLPEVAVTITPVAVLFPAIDRPSALAPRIRAEEWSREGTSAEILPASGLQTSRVVFTRQDAGKRRRRMVSVDSLDVDARVIVDALSGPHTS